MKKNTQKRSAYYKGPAWYFDHCLGTFEIFTAVPLTSKNPKAAAANYITYQIKNKCKLCTNTRVTIDLDKIKI